MISASAGIPVVRGCEAPAAAVMNKTNRNAYTVAWEITVENLTLNGSSCENNEAGPRAGVLPVRVPFSGH